MSGNTGSGKTLFAAEFLAHGIAQFDEPGVFVSFEERPPDIRRNLASFGFDVEAWEAAGTWLFVDASASPPDEGTVGDFDFGGLISPNHGGGGPDRGSAGVVRLAGRGVQSLRQLRNLAARSS